MTKKLNHIISISLVFIFLTPMTVKLFDSLFHHHDHFICTAKNEHHFHVHHEKCPIPNFELSFYSLHKPVLETQKTYYPEELYINYVSNYFCDKSKYSFLLRAPPIRTNLCANI